MWTLTKPPLLVKLFLKFFKYDNKIVITKLHNLKITKLLVVENISVYFLMYKKYWQQVTNNLFLMFGKHFLQTFNLSLILKATHFKFWENKTIYTIALQTIVEYGWFFFRKDLTLNWTKFIYTSSINNRTPTVRFFLIKNMVLTLNKYIFQKNFVLLDHISSIFFLNIFFFPLFLGFHQHNISNNLLNWWIIFYFGLDFAKLFFFTKYDEIFSIYNWFLTIQTGILKNSNYFVDRNYIFGTSAQLLRARKMYFLKFFFKNSRFWSFQKTKIFFEEIDKELVIEGIYTWSRSTQIMPFLVNWVFFVYNGNRFIWVWVLPGMVGYKLGQFSYTWKIFTRNINFKNSFKNFQQSQLQ